MDELETKRALGAEVKRRRIAVGLSQQAFAQMLGMNRTRVREIENGTGNPQLNTLIRLAAGLDTTLPDLFASIHETEDTL